MVRTISDGIVISPIKNGTVIDHITPGEGLTVLRILGIRDGTNVTVIVASNVPSSRGGRKDMVRSKTANSSKMKWIKSLSSPRTRPSVSSETSKSR